MSWTLCTSGAAIRKAGANANSTIVASGSAIQDWTDQAEGYIISFTRRDWVDSYSSVDAGVKHALADCCSDLVAKKIINYDMSGYTSRLEAQTMLDVLDDNANRILKELKDFKSNKIVAP